MEPNAPFVVDEDVEDIPGMEMDIIKLSALNKWAHEATNTLPQVVKGGTLKQELNRTLWPTFIRFAPNPTLQATDPPTDHYLMVDQKVVFWYPEIFFSWYFAGDKMQPRCPKCGFRSESVGWNDRLRRVFALGKPYFVLSKRWKCKDKKNCGEFFSSISEQVMAQYPAFISSQLDIVFTEKLAVDGQLYRLIQSMVVIGGVSFSSLCDIFREQFNTDCLRIIHQFCSYWHIKQSKTICVDSQEVRKSRVSLFFILT